MDDVSPEMKRILDYIDGKGASDKFTEELDLLHKRFIVFELDNIKDHKILFPITTIIIMEAFINKMRKLKGIRKLILIEEAWKAIASANMADYIKYLCAPVKVAS